MKCPFCNRNCTTKDGKVIAHLLPGVEHSFTEVASIGDRYCPMSDQYHAIDGDDNADYRRRALQVMDLATQIRDGDPAMVWTVLTTIPDNELQRLMVVALAGIDTERSVNDAYGWVCDLPAARWAS